MNEATGLVVSNYNLVYNALSFATATLGIAFVFFLVSRSRVSGNYRSAVTMSAMICGVAAYHYWRMFSNFSAGSWNEGYRYADWLLTVPLLVAELVVVSYASEVKFDVLGVTNGPVVSEAAAIEMAKGAQRVLGSSIGLALTGVAGPADQEGLKPGTLCVGLALPDGSTQSALLQLPGNRDTMRQLSVISALDLLRRALRAI